MKQELKDIMVIAAVLCIIPVVLAGVCIVLLIGFAILDSPSPSVQATIGDYQRTAYCAYYVFQDGTIYGEYQYTQASFEGNPYFEPVTQENKQKVLMFVHDYERWVEGMADNPTPEAQELYQAYRYDSTSLSEADYYYVDVKYPDRPTSNYELFLFDYETMTLYRLKSWL